jgi:hypothetical protein
VKKNEVADIPDISDNCSESNVSLNNHSLSRGQNKHAMIEFMKKEPLTRVKLVEILTGFSKTNINVQKSCKKNIDVFLLGHL